MRAEPDALVVESEVRDGAAEGEQQLSRVTITLVLLHGIVHGLLGDVVLQLEGEHRQPVDERHEIDGVAPVAGGCGAPGV